MTRLVRITLHVDPFDMAQGGAWEQRDLDGHLEACHAFPALPDGEQSMEHAAEWLADHCRRTRPGGQLRLFP